MVLLTSHLLNGKRVGVDIPLNSIIEVPFKVENTPSAGYADISSIENWWKYGEQLEDYLYVRFEINNLVSKKGIEACISTSSTPPLTPNPNDRYFIDPDEKAEGAWGGYEGWTSFWDGVLSSWRFEPPEWVGYRLCSAVEKEICAQLKIGSQADHFLEWGVPTIVDYGLSYHKKSRLTREERMLKTTVEVYNILPLNVAEALTNITASPLGDMYTRYIEFGVKGTAEDYNKDYNPNPTPGICDWVMARAPFNGQEPYITANYPTGLLIKEWAPIDGRTIESFANTIYRLLTKGGALV